MFSKQQIHPFLGGGCICLILFFCQPSSLCMGNENTICIERAIVPLTHTAVARAYANDAKGFPVVGDATTSDRWADLLFRYHFELRNIGTESVTVRISAEKPVDFNIAQEFRSEPEKVEIDAGETILVTLVIKVPGEAAAKLPMGYKRDITIQFAGEGIDDVADQIVFWIPAVAKILAGANGKGLPADVLPEGAYYADEFSGGWDGSKFKTPFLMATEKQVADWRKMVASGMKPDRQDQYWHFGNPGIISEDSPLKVIEERGHETQAPMGEAILNLALSWAYTGKKADAEKASKLILGYVDRAQRLGFGQAGRVGSNGLSEAWFTNPVFRAIGLLTEAESFTDEELKRIKHWMAYEANVIQDQIFGFNNMQCEANFPVMAAGLFAGDFKYFRFAYYPPYGMQGQLSGAFFADGFHREKQVGYHYRAINPIVDQAEVLLRLGFCVYDDRVHRALMNPVARSMAPGDDFGGQDIPACEVAYLRYRDPLAADWLRITRRQQRLPLFHGALPLPEPSGDYWQKGSSHMSISGQTVLRTGNLSDDIRAVRLHWGFPGKRQGKDFMDCSFLYRGQIFGAGDYGVNDSLGHGVIVVNEQSMNESGGFPVELGLNEDFPYVVAVNPGSQNLDDSYGAAEWPYPWPWKNVGGSYGTYLPLSIPGHRERQWTPMYDGATWTRAIAAIEGGFLVVDRVVLDTPGRIDRPLHLSAGYGSLKELTTSLKLVYQPGAIGNSAQYLAAIPGAPVAPKMPAGILEQSSTSPESDTDDILHELDGNKEQEDRNAAASTPSFPQTTTDETWMVTALNQRGEHSFYVRGTILGIPATRIIKIQSLPLGWGYHSPFLLIRHDRVTQARFITFIEPYGYSGKMDARDTFSRPKMLGMKRLSVSTKDGVILTHEQATALELDFGDRQVIAIINDSGDIVQAAGIQSAKQFTAISLNHKQE